MNYKITVRNSENHFCNPLLALDGKEYVTRDEACNAIYSRLYDVIDGEAGCEMVDKAETPKAYWVLSGEGERGTWHRIVTTKIGIKRHLAKERRGGDRFASAIAEIYRTSDDTVAGYAVKDDGTLGEPKDAPDEAAGDIGEANDVREIYIKTCRDYILREGYASHDGVSAIVEEVA